MSTAPPSDSGESYVEGSAFVELLASKGKAKMLDVFLSKRHDDLSAADVADLAGIDRSTFDRNVGTFLDLGIVVESRRVGNTQLYTLDTDHQISKDLGRLHADLLEYVDVPEASASSDAAGSESVQSDSP